MLKIIFGLAIGVFLGFWIAAGVIVKCTVGDMQCIMIENEPQYVIIFNDQKSKDKVPTLPFVCLNVKRRK